MVFNFGLRITIPICVILVRIASTFGFNLGKKLLPAKKAWKSFSATFQSKLQKLKLRKAIKRAKKRCVLAFNYIRPLLSRKFYSLMIRRHTNSSKRPLQRRHHNTLNFPAIYVDELFPEPLISAPPPKRHGEEQQKEMLARGT
nr:uncharacterized protein LOC109175308 [Ipomoea trifida]